jgi:hypothetical protein
MLLIGMCSGKTKRLSYYLSAVQTATTVGVGALIIAGIWEGLKYTGAVLGAPETAGASLGLLALP